MIIKEILSHSTLLSALVERQLSARYRGSILGFLWSFLNPLVLMIVYTVVFQHFTRVGAMEFYSLYLFSGLLPWMWTASALSEGTCSITSSGHLVTKSLFPAHILVLANVITTGIHFVLMFPLFIVFAFIWGMPLPLAIFLFPVLIFIHGVFLFGLSLGLSSLNVRFRDVQHLVGSVITIMFFLCPIIYPLSMVPEQYLNLFVLNPFSAFTVLYHAVLFGEYSHVQAALYSVVVWSFLAVMFGFSLFSRGRERFAEYL